MRVQFDAHMHVHPQASVDRISELAEAVNAPLVLAVVETSRGGEFDRLRGHARWTEVDEPGSLALNVPEPNPVFAIFGRQIVSTDRLEVLAIGLSPDHPVSALADRAHSTSDLIDRVLDAGAVAVLPWGVGKWWGARGVIVRGIVSDSRYWRHSRFFIGDISARSRSAPVPLPFRAPIRILAGSDPLPLSGSEEQVAGYRNELDIQLDRNRPQASLLSALEGGTAVMRRGTTLPWGRAVRDQIRLAIARQRSGR